MLRFAQTSAMLIRWSGVPCLNVPRTLSSSAYLRVCFLALSCERKLFQICMLGGSANESVEVAVHTVTELMGSSISV